MSGAHGWQKSWQPSWRDCSVTNTALGLFSGDWPPGVCHCWGGRGDQWTRAMIGPHLELLNSIPWLYWEQAKKFYSFSRKFLRIKVVKKIKEKFPDLLSEHTLKKSNITWVLGKRLLPCQRLWCLPFCSVPKIGIFWGQNKSVSSSGRKQMLREREPDRSHAADKSGLIPSSLRAQVLVLLLPLEATGGQTCPSPRGEYPPPVPAVWNLHAQSRWVHGNTGWGRHRLVVVNQLPLSVQSFVFLRTHEIYHWGIAE